MWTPGEGAEHHSRYVYALPRTPTHFNISFHLSNTVCTLCICVSLFLSFTLFLSLCLVADEYSDYCTISYRSISLTNSILTINLKSENKLGEWLPTQGKWLLGFKILCFIFAVGEYVGVQLANNKLFLPTGKSWEKNTNQNMYSTTGKRRRRQAKKILRFL